MADETGIWKIGYLVAVLAILGIGFIGTASALDIEDPNISVKILAPDEFMPDSIYFIGIKYIVNEVYWDEPASHPEMLFDAGSAEIVANLSGRFDATNTTHTCTFNLDGEIAEEKNETVVVIIKTGSSGSVDIQVTAKAHDDDDYDDIVTATDSISVPIKELNPNSVEYFKELAEQRKMLFEQYLYLVNETLMGTQNDVAKMNDEAMQTALFKVTSASCEMVLEEVISSGAGAFLDPVMGVEGVYDYMDFTNDAINGFEGKPLFSTMNWIFDWCDNMVNKMELDGDIRWLFQHSPDGPDDPLNKYVSLIDEEITCWNNSDFSGLKSVLREEEEFRDYHFDYLKVSNGIDSYDSLPEDTRTYVKILYKSVGNSMESDYRLIEDHIEPAVREPSPRFVSVPDNTVNLGGGDEYEFFFKIKNTGGTADDSYFSLSVSEGLEIIDYSSDKPNGKFTIYFKGDSIFHHDDYQMPAEYTLLDWYRPWLGAEEEQTLKVRIKGTGAGDQWIKYRLAFRPKLDGLSFVRNPTSCELDQQGWHVYRIYVNVGEVSNNKPSADFSFALCQTSLVYQEYEVYENEGLTVDGNTGYYLTDWMGERYVAINGSADKLCKLLVEFEDDNHLTLGYGDKWDLGGGFALVAKQIDTDGEEVWLSLEKHGGELDDKVVSIWRPGGTQQDHVYTFTADIGGEENIPVFSCYVHAIFMGKDNNYVMVKYVFLINNDTIAIDTGDEVCVMNDLNVEFTSLSTDPDGDDLSYYWDFDDGSGGAAENPTHEYESGGDYNVTLTVTDTKGLSDYKTKRVHVNEKPEADFTFSADGTRVVFASNSTDDGSIVSWDWDFGDGGTGDGEVVSHEYSSAGSYDVTLTVIDGNEAIDSTTKEIIVGEGANVIYVPDDYMNIQCAVDNATAGDTIIVRSGTYHENVDVDKRLALRGVDTGGGKPVVDASGSGSPITLSADEITLEGFTVTNARIYHPDAGISVTSNNNAIIGNNVINNKEGILLLSSNNNTIIENNVNNASADYGVGIILSSSSNNTITNNTVSNNSFYSSHIHGIRLSSSNSNTITGNTANSNWRGIGLIDSINNVITGNIANLNEQDGIEIRSSRNNTITGNTANSNNDGIVLVSSSNNILNDNTANSNGLNGLCIHNSFDNTIIANNASNTHYYGIAVYRSNNNKIYLNNFVKNRVGTYSRISSNIWNSTEPITYQYNNSTFTNYLGNYWGPNYSGTDADCDGIRDTPCLIPDSGGVDWYPLMETWTAPADSTQPILTITSPAPNTTTHTPTITVTGTASDLSGIASVTVDDALANEAADWSTWRAEVSLTEGPNTITAVATDNAGNQNTTIITVYLESTSTLSIGSANAPLNSTITIPVSVANVANISGISFDLLYNSSVVIVTNVSASENFTGSSIRPNIDNANGITNIVLTNSNLISASAETPVIDIAFNITGGSGSSTSLDLQNVEFSDDNSNPYPPAVVMDGQITVGIKGDFNGNGRVDIGDVAKVAFMVAGKVPEDLNADFNNNGRVDIGDAAKIAFYLAGKVSEL